MIAEPDDDGRVQSVVAERGPTVLRIALGGQLRKLREGKGITREAAGDAIRGSHAKISRLELGRTGFKERDIRDLLTLYGVHDPEERESFLELARKANEPGWWHRYSDLLPSWFGTYLGLEQAATKIRTYEAHLVPGLLQTPEYTRAVVTLGYEDADTDRRVAVRQRRQEILHRSDPPFVWAVIDEAALHRPVGGADVHRAQMHHLVELAQLPNVTIQVVPYSAGEHAAAGSSFSILRFAEPELPDIVYLEHLTSALYLDRREDLALYLSVMDRLSVQAARPERSIEIISDYAKGL
ncbi:helix-turn-helix domain-containing protein [Nocardia cyriacigeorgica]|jgi:transcriptional regulator with XRE-family HTH domain|uniref:helix-turn-helix domain-containing protein n=1 Tax=Nocardia cyriacigeorgica TaxID=135487 RepID=UPI000CE9C9BE|nr:helix-turn-helix transcriptional regulator [Nocardia cyriacigeorgica]AVH23788.1 transcriptional regulator [Nocardia cyriacigeorgica]MBF6094831.1 helix-turn-helix domain-containing protein [Nocardia cyriacigeorgica]MBF6324080.1 helix-turn-helix domain-containing protein [Nocardia cyriacigeorgica]MBF6399153.1 helix-turn-helix domain-containing protein [Nocardia cyriacigeorgica]MBF6404784.1 helix-turn-helix domain-containing protein [Nocardia cyriacigeorgica]